MNRKLVHLVPAALLALPLALPGVALAQAQGGSTTGDFGGGTVGSRNQKPETGTMGDSTGTTGATTRGATGLGTGAQPLGSTSSSDAWSTPPAGSLGTSGSTRSSDRSVGGDINKSTRDMGATSRHRDKDLDR